MTSERAAHFLKHMPIILLLMFLDLIHIVGVKLMEKHTSQKVEWSSILILAIILIGLLATIGLSGCAVLSPAQQEVSQNTFYRRDMKVSVDGVDYPGYGVLPVKDSYEFKVQTNHEMDRFKQITCHREIIEEKVGDKGFLSKATKYSFTLRRLNSVERSDPCPLELIASADSNDHTWAYFDFAAADEKLPAKIECDGWNATYNGVSVCQSAVGLMQKISFSEPVKTSFDADCPMPPAPDEKTFIFPINAGKCVYIFYGTTSKQFHRLTTLGWQDVWLRKAK
jgi:hypothetical protein